MLVVQIVQLQAVARGHRMLLRHREQEGLVEQRLDMQLIVVDRQRQQAGVEAAVAQPGQDLVGLLFDQQQFQAREALAQAGHHMRQQIRAEGREQAQAHRARFRVLAAAGDLAHLLDVGDHFARALGDVAPDRGQHDPARRALDQGYAQLVLELFDLGRKRGLAHEAGRGRAAEVLVIGQGDQIFEVTKVHRRLSIEDGYRHNRNNSFQ